MYGSLLLLLLILLCELLTLDCCFSKKTLFLVYNPRGIEFFRLISPPFNSFEIRFLSTKNTFPRKNVISSLTTRWALISQAASLIFCVKRILGSPNIFIFLRQPLLTHFIVFNTWITIFLF